MKLVQLYGVSSTSNINSFIYVCVTNGRIKWLVDSSRRGIFCACVFNPSVKKTKKPTRPASSSRATYARRGGPRVALASYAIGRAAAVRARASKGMHPSMYFIFSITNHIRENGKDKQTRFLLLLFWMAFFVTFDRQHKQPTTRI